MTKDCIYMCDSLYMSYPESLNAQIQTGSCQGLEEGGDGEWLLTGVGVLFSGIESVLELGRRGFPDGSDGKESACNVGNLVSIPGSGRSSGEGSGNPLQNSCLENPMGGAWQATVHGVAKSCTRLSDFTSELGRSDGPTTL